MAQRLGLRTLISLLTFMISAPWISAAAGEPAQSGGTLPGNPEISAVMVAAGFERPVNVTSAGDGSGRLFVVERSGAIRIVTSDGTVLDDPFLSIPELVETGGMEQGLLGLAFHPDYATNGRFFIYYSAAGNGTLTLAEYAVAGEEPDRADPASGTVLLEIEDPFRNHNGGELEFGPEGYLYIAVGDGGGAGDPHDNAQNLESLLGKILRIDIDGETPYGIPADNPFVDAEGAPEVFAYGLRNPWQFSFDSVTGDLFIADVGQGAWEEINLIPAGTGGLNFGWPEFEGSHCYRSGDGACEPFGMQPIAEYSHAEGGCSIIGLGVARSGELPAVSGIYFAADWCSGTFYGLGRDDAGAWQLQELFDSSLGVLGGGNGEDGSVYFTSDDFDGSSGGALWKLAEADSITGNEITPPLD